MKSKALKAAAIALATAGLIATPLLIAAPANATTPAGCISGYACFWKDASYLTGGVSANSFSFFIYVSDYSKTGQDYLNTATNINDTLTSAYDAGTTNTYWYKDANASGDLTPEFVLTKATGDGNVSNTTGYVQSEPNDSVSASYFAAYNPN
jgi:hypothetical protein